MGANRHSVPHSCRKVEDVRDAAGTYRLYWTPVRGNLHKWSTERTFMLNAASSAVAAGAGCEFHASPGASPRGSYWNDARGALWPTSRYAVFASSQENGVISQKALRITEVSRANILPCFKGNNGSLSVCEASS
ncbi:hypothetical protein BaRGS_00022548 [Batillaria attramentaria]|uniref:Uncharacterized protein n=1 Tax=Batillaria attramentaria TaxID=370345 RepID=A0ABD0KGC5_9CAEN